MHLIFWLIAAKQAHDTKTVANRDRGAIDLRTVLIVLGILVLIVVLIKFVDVNVE